MHEDRHGGAAHDLVGDAAKEQTRQATAAVRRQGKRILTGDLRE